MRPQVMLLASPAVDITREDAASQARQELLKQEYSQARPSIMDRILGWLGEKIAETMSTLGASRAGLMIFFAVLLAAVVVLVLLVRRGAFRRLTGGPEALFDSAASTTAHHHRRQAHHYAQADQWDLALRELLRAIARHIEEEGVLEPRPGRTAEEIATEAGALFPAIAQPLRTAVRLFEDVWYGQHHASQEHYRTMNGLDTHISTQRWQPNEHASDELPHPVTASQAGSR